MVPESQKVERLSRRFDNKVLTFAFGDDDAAAMVSATWFSQVAEEIGIDLRYFSLPPSALSSQWHYLYCIIPLHYIPLHPLSNFSKYY